MRIALPCKVDDIKGPIDDHFGSSRLFTIYDPVTNEWEFVKYDVFVDGNSQEYFMAKDLIDENVSTIITGQIDPKTEEIFNESNVRIIRNKYGKISDIVSEFTDN